MVSKTDKEITYKSVDEIIYLQPKAVNEIASYEFEVTLTSFDDIIKCREIASQLNKLFKYSILNPVNFNSNNNTLPEKLTGLFCFFFPLSQYCYSFIQDVILSQIKKAVQISFNNIVTIRTQTNQYILAG